VLLLVGTALTARSLERLLDVDPGFEPEGVLAVEVALPGYRYAGKQEWIAFFDRLEQRLAARPEVASVGYTWLLPFTGNQSGRNFEIEGRTPPASGDAWNAGARVADAGYFRTLRIPLLEGRLFEPGDRDGAPRVAVVGETMASRFWPAGDAIGSRFRVDDDQPWITIVGVVGDVRHLGLDIEPYPEFYVHRAQIAANFGAVVTRSSDRDAASAAAAVRAALHEIDPELPLVSIATMTERIDRTVGRRRAITGVVGAFGAAALLLAAIGIYGVVSYTVAQRRREIGVRMALGSAAGGVLRLFLRDGMSLVALGAALGTAGALALGSFVRAQLFAVDARDPWSFVAAVLVLAVVALAAVLIPARRAARLDPVETLRAE
jgi:predicted permease